MNYDEIIKGLFSNKTSIVFKSLCALNSTIIDERVFSPLKNIAENSTTFKNKKLAFVLIGRHFAGNIDSINFRTNTNLGYIYFIKEKLSGSIKIGRSRNLNKRLKIFATKLPFEIEVLHYILTYDYERIELELHKHYSTKRLNGEWFKLNELDINDILTNNFPDNILNLINTSPPSQQAQNPGIKDTLKIKSYSFADLRLTLENAYKPWTLLLDQELSELYCKGEKISSMATYFGRTKGAILSRIKKNQLEELYGKRKI